MSKESKKVLLKNIKILEANHKALKNFSKKKYIDNDGYARISLYLNNNNIFNQYTNPNTPELSDEIIDFIEREAYFIPVEYPIKLIIITNQDINYENIKNALHLYYWKKLADKNNDLKKNRWISIILFIIGILFLSLFFALQLNENISLLFNEIFSIIGSFAIWESADYALLNRNALRIEYLNLAQLALISVEKNN